jgi:hypothetical protein
MRVPVSVTVSTKSAASSASACERKNRVQVVAARSVRVGQLQSAFGGVRDADDHVRPGHGRWVGRAVRLTVSVYCRG